MQDVSEGERKIVTKEIKKKHCQTHDALYVDESVVCIRYNVMLRKDRKLRKVDLSSLLVPALQNGDF